MHVLSQDADLEAKLRHLLTAASAWLPTHTRELTPRLTLLMGSAACGEASGVRLPGGWLPLSDLDLGVFVEGETDEARCSQLAGELRDAVEPVVAAEGLLSNPVDLGFASVSLLERVPPRLELYEAAADPRVLSGDPQVLEPLRQRDAPPFESLRLILNRIAETIVAEGTAESGEGAPTWPENDPGVEDWRRAHRWAKFVHDFGKAHLAARGQLVASFRQRLELLETRGAEPAVIADYRAWTGWRLAPTWPPPPVDVGALARLAAETTRRVYADATGAGAFHAEDRRTWQRLLRSEGGAGRERARRWEWFVRRRPGGIRKRAVLPLALRWGAYAWPGSLVTLALALTWMHREGGLPVGENPDTLIRSEFAGVSAREDAFGCAADLALWARKAGA